MKTIGVVGAVFAFGMLVGCSGDEENTPPTLDAGNDVTSSHDGGTDSALLNDASDGEAGEVDAGPCPAMKDAGMSFGVAACDDCMGRSCCTEIGACASDPDCRALVSCLRACDESDGGSTCTDACKAAHADALSKLGDLSDCRTSLCGTDCPQ